MPKVKEKSEGEYLRSKIRSLEKENRHLKKRVRNLEKKEHIFDDISNDIPELTIGNSNEKLPNLCDSCGKGYLIEKSVIGRVYEECNICGERSPVKRYDKIE